MKKHLIIPALLALAACSTPADVTYNIDTAADLQTMDNFGASDAWSMQFLGLWPQEKQQTVADWLFSTENDENGKPKGIGLSVWRFNIGAGSSEQGDDSQIAPGTRTECFLQADGSYNWDKQQGQRNFLRLAKERGVEQFLGFLNSPPVYYTKNGLATNTGREGGSLNLKEKHYGDFAKFLANVVEGLEEHEGIHIDYLSPFNEPDGHWNWLGPKQEGTPAHKQEIAAAVRLISKEFEARGLTTQIVINESSDYRCMFSTHETGPERGYQIQSFFCPDSADTYVGDLPNVPRLILGHSYWTNTPLESLRDYRAQLRDTLDKYGVDFWETETCIMGNDEEIGGGGGYDFTMTTALYVARIIHHDIVYAGSKSWHWWRAVGGDYKDGLIREFSDRGAADGEVKDSKLMWALGNYSRFVRPGAVRKPVTATGPEGEDLPQGDTDPTGLMCTAYQNTDDKLAVVVINYSELPYTIALNPSGIEEASWMQYRTSDVEGEDLLPAGTVEGTAPATIPARSIVTFTQL